MHVGGAAGISGARHSNDACSQMHGPAAAGDGCGFVGVWAGGCVAVLLLHGCVMHGPAAAGNENNMCVYIHVYIHIYIYIYICGNGLDHFAK